MENVQKSNIFIYLPRRVSLRFLVYFLLANQKGLRESKID
jgi:hypothetical protein